MPGLRRSVRSSDAGAGVEFWAGLRGVLNVLSEQDRTQNFVKADGSRQGKAMVIRSTKNG